MHEKLLHKDLLDCQVEKKVAKLKLTLKKKKQGLTFEAALILV